MNHPENITQEYLNKWIHMHICPVLEIWADRDIPNYTGDNNASAVLIERALAANTKEHILIEVAQGEPPNFKVIWNGHEFQHRYQSIAVAGAACASRGFNVTID